LLIVAALLGNFHANGGKGTMPDGIIVNFEKLISLPPAMVIPAIDRLPQRISPLVGLSSEKRRTEP